MDWEAWAAVAVVVLIVLALLRGLAGPDMALLGGLFLLMTVGLVSGRDRIPSPAALVRGFGSEGVATIAVLFVVAEGLRRTGAAAMLVQPLLGRPRTLMGAQARLMIPVAALSAFLNNTPIVAIFVPVVRDWCRKTGISPSKLFIPLSFAAIMGGSCTLIGTATNVFVNGMVLDARSVGQLPDTTIAMFSITWIGVPAAILGIAYLLLVGGRWLPDRRPVLPDAAAARQYTVEMFVESGSAIEGRSIEAAGLRHLPGVYLSGIDRDGERLVAVGPQQILHGGDRLIFVGLVESVVDLQKIRGLVPATDQVFKLADPRPDRQLVEAVVSSSCPMVGDSIRVGRFRTVYDAVVIAVHRHGEHVADRKIGDIVLRPGDTLLLEAHPRFVDEHRNRSDFFLVSAIADSTPLRHDRAWLALGLLVAMVVLAATETLSLLHAALGAAGLMVLFRAMTGETARRSIQWRVLLAMGAALGIGRALESTGAAQAMAGGMLDMLRPLGPWGLLGGVYVLAMIFNSLIGPIGSAAIVFPVAKAAALTGQWSFMPFVVTLMVAASASFATPMSYQTNLMVYGAGGYRFGDYLRVGLPLNLLVMVVALAVAPWRWPFVSG